MNEIGDIAVAFIHSIPYVVKRAGVKIAGQEGRFAGTRRCCNPGKGDFQGVVQSVKKPFAAQYFWQYRLGDFQYRMAHVGCSPDIDVCPIEKIEAQLETLGTSSYFSITLYYFCDLYPIYTSASTKNCN